MDHIRVLVSNSIAIIRLGPFHPALAIFGKILLVENSLLVTGLVEIILVLGENIKKFPKKNAYIAHCPGIEILNFRFLVSPEPGAVVGVPLIFFFVFVPFFVANVFARLQHKSLLNRIQFCLNFPVNFRDQVPVGLALNFFPTKINFCL
jgi:hypothetical protein